MWLSKLRAAWVAFYIRQSDTYPMRWYWPIVRIYGGLSGTEIRTCYMTRVVLSPKTRWGQFYLHVFHREDMDRDPHDHPFAYSTLPINQGYTETVYIHHQSEPPQPGRNECFEDVYVGRLTWQHRPARHTHRVIGCDRGWPLVTLVWRFNTERKWGFWCHSAEKVARTPSDPTRIWVPWVDYVYGGEHANIQGQDNICPGVNRRD